MLSALMDAVEARTSYANPERWFRDFLLGGSESASGIAVTAPVALTYAAVYRAVNLISDYVGKIPLVTYKRTQGLDKEPAKEHPAYKLLRFKPHPLIPSMAFRKTLQSHVLLHGNGYAYIARDGAAKPTELTPLDPTATYPDVVKGRLWYITYVDGVPTKILPENILHLRGLPKNGIECYSVIGRANESIGLGLAARKYGAKFFRNFGFGKVVLEHPAKLSPIAKQTIRDSWMEIHSGLENAHKPAVLEEGMSAKPLSISMEDAQFLETRQFEIREIANWFGLPPHKLGDTTRTAFASLEQENQSLLDDCLDPWFCTWEEEARDKLLTEDEKETDSHVVEFKRQALIRANLTDRYNAYRVAVGRPFMVPNEARALENMPAMEGGDDLQSPANMNNPGGNPDVTEEPPKGGKPDKEPNGQPKRQRALEYQRRLILADAGRAVRRLTTHARKAAEKPQTFLAFLETLEQDHGRSLSEILSPAVEATQAAMGQEPDAAPVVERLIEAVRAALLAASGSARAAELPVAVAAVMAESEGSLPAEIADILIRQVTTFQGALSCTV